MLSVCVRACPILSSVFIHSIFVCFFWTVKTFFCIFLVQKIVGCKKTVVWMRYTRYGGDGESKERVSRSAIARTAPKRFPFPANNTAPARLFSLPDDTTQVEFEQLINTLNTDNTRWQTLGIADLYLNKLDKPADIGDSTLADYIVSKAPATDISGKLDEPSDFGNGTLADYIVSKALPRRTLVVSWTNLQILEMVRSRITSIQWHSAYTLERSNTQVTRLIPPVL